jgi:hypothetical protein
MTTKDWTGQNRPAIGINSRTHILSRCSVEAKEQSYHYSCISVGLIVQGFQNGIPPPEDPSSAPVRKSFRELVVHKLPSRNGKPVIELFQSQLFRLRHSQEDHDERQNIQSTIESKSARWRQRRQHVGEG